MRPNCNPGGRLLLLRWPMAFNIRAIGFDRGQQVNKAILLLYEQTAWPFGRASARFSSPQEIGEPLCPLLKRLLVIQSGNRAQHLKIIANIGP